jgi:hypothetical protein
MGTLFGCVVSCGVRFSLQRATNVDESAESPMTRHQQRGLGQTRETLQTRILSAGANGQAQLPRRITISTAYLLRAEAAAASLALLRLGPPALRHIRRDERTWATRILGRSLESLHPPFTLFTSLTQPVNLRKAGSTATGQICHVVAGCTPSGQATLWLCSLVPGQTLCCDKHFLDSRHLSPERRCPSTKTDDSVARFHTTRDSTPPTSLSVARKHEVGNNLLQNQYIIMTPDAKCAFDITTPSMTLPHRRHPQILIFVCNRL